MAADNNVILTKQTIVNARGNGNKNPDNILRNMEPGMANDCKLYNVSRNIPYLSCVYVIQINMDYITKICNKIWTLLSNCTK